MECCTMRDETRATLHGRVSVVLLTENDVNLGGDDATDELTIDACSVSFRGHESRYVMLLHNAYPRR